MGLVDGSAGPVLALPWVASLDVLLELNVE